MIPVKGNEIGKEICKAINEDPGDVLELTIHSLPNAAVTITVVRHLTNEMGEKIVDIIKKYAWKEVEA